MTTEMTTGERGGHSCVINYVCVVEVKSGREKCLSRRNIRSESYEWVKAWGIQWSKIV